MSSNRLSTVALLSFVLLSGTVWSQKLSVIGERDRERRSDEENLNVFHQWMKWNNGGSLLMQHLTEQATALYQRRDREIAQLKTKEDWQTRQKVVRDKLREIFGPFPAKTPLKPVITGTIKKEGYRIEKVVYESHPGFYVTGLLYVPSRVKGRAPAVLNLIGHEQEGFRAALDQVMATNLVKKGIVVLTIDPLGQGEHVQNFDRKVNFSSIGYSVVEHCYFGNQCFLSGVNSAKYFVWDAIRGIDYLLSRKEVDPQRIGVTGFSGGGTITSFVGALDERVAVAIPSSWSTANRRQLETKGAQDAEATLIHSLAKGITLEDLLEVRAPKPTLLTFTSRDEYLSLQGARDALAEASKAYDAFGAAGRLELVEDDARHWLTPKIRERIFGFFMTHFGIAGDAAETDVEILPATDLVITSTGQIATSLGGDMVFDVNRRETERLMASLQESRTRIADHLLRTEGKAREISGYVPREDNAKSFINGRYQRDGYTVAKLAVPGEGKYPIPFLLFVPDGGSAPFPAIVYAHGTGKAVEAQRGGEIEKLVRRGYIVAAPDVLGTGETLNTASRGLADGYTGVLIGRSIVAIQAGDIVTIVNYLKQRPDVNALSIGGIGMGNMAIPMLHAAAFEPTLRGVILRNSLISYRSVAMNRDYRIGVTARPNGGHQHPYEIDFSWGIANVLTGYDLPDLVGTLAPRKVVLAGLTDQMLQPASETLIQEEMKFPLDAYAFRNGSANIRILPSSSDLTKQADWILGQSEEQ